MPKEHLESLLKDEMRRERKKILKESDSAVSPDFPSTRTRTRIRIRTQTNTNPNDTETNGAGRSGNARALRKQSKYGVYHVQINELG